MKSFWKIATLALLVSGCNQIETTESAQPRNQIDLKKTSLIFERLVSAKSDPACASVLADDVGKIQSIDISYHSTSGKYSLTWWRTQISNDCNDASDPKCYESSESQTKTIAEESINDLEAKLNSIPQPLKESDCPNYQCAIEDLRFDRIDVDSFTYADNCHLGGQEYSTKVSEVIRSIKNMVTE